MFTVLSVAHAYNQQQQQHHKNQIKVNKYQTILGRCFFFPYRCAILLHHFLFSLSKQLAASAFFIFFSIRFNSNTNDFIYILELHFILDSYSIRCFFCFFFFFRSFFYRVRLFVCLFVSMLLHLYRFAVDICAIAELFAVSTQFAGCVPMHNHTHTHTPTTTTSWPIDTRQQQTRCIAGENTSAGV